MRFQKQEKNLNPLTEFFALVKIKVLNSPCAVFWPRRVFY